MSFSWSSYPGDYRRTEVAAITTATAAGECVALAGLSGAGKSNLLGFLAYRVALPPPAPRFVLIDCNRLVEFTPGGFFRLVRQALEPTPLAAAADELAALDASIGQRLGDEQGLCLLLDRFDALSPPDGENPGSLAPVFSNLRALRDAYKYQLTCVIAARRPPALNSELAELFYANTLWLGPLSESDARWNIARFAKRYAGRPEIRWDEPVIEALLGLSGGYPSFLRALCEAWVGQPAGTTRVDWDALRRHPAVERRVAEFLADEPDEAALRLSGLSGHPLLPARRPSGLAGFDTSSLTAKEYLLLEYFLARAGQVCEKDDLIRAVWPEDRVFMEGVRDDSLAQLVRRLRKKVEVDPSEPAHIHTVPGRGYRFI